MGFYFCSSDADSILPIPKDRDLFFVFVFFHFILIAGMLYLFHRLNRKTLFYQVLISAAIYLLAFWTFGYFAD